MWHMLAHASFGEAMYEQVHVTISDRPSSFPHVHTIFSYWVFETEEFDRW